MRHRLNWTRDPAYDERKEDPARAYCWCGWIAPTNKEAEFGVDLPSRAIQRKWFAEHLEEIRINKGG